LPDTLTNPADRAALVAFLETIDVRTVPFVPLAVRQQGNQVEISWETIVGARYALEAKPSLNVGWAALGPTVIGAGNRASVLVNIDTVSKFLRLVAAP